MTTSSATPNIGVDLYWIPLGAGASVVRANGWVFATVAALVRRRPRRPIYHSALIVDLPSQAVVIEMTPVADDKGPQDRGVVAEGPAGSSWAGRFRRFRYEIHRWDGGLIPDLAAAVGGPVRVTSDGATAQRVLELVPLVPTPTWGRDELKAGGMWNSNSVISWLLAGAGIDDAAGEPPMLGSAPGWDAGLAVARRPHCTNPNPPARNPRHLLRQIAGVVHDVPAFLTAPLRRRWHLRWGATSAEAEAELPGDLLVPSAQFRATRAITINAPPESVWPWLVQVGCGRAGFYSNDLLDNLAHPSADRIIPELQDLEVGQWVPMSPTPTERTAMKVHSFETNRWLLWTKSDGTWVWQITPTDSNGTRLVTRIHARYDWHHPLSALVGVVLMEFGDFAMLRRMLRGIKSRAESLEMRATREIDRANRVSASRRLQNQSGSQKELA